MSYNPVPSLNNGNATFNNDVNVSGVSRFNAGVKTKLNTEADGATITFDMNESSSHTAELGGNRTLDVSNVDAGQKFSLRLKQDATGNHTVNWWNNISWMSVDGSEPTLRTSGVDYFGFVCTSGGYYEGFHLTEASTGGGGGSASITVKEADGTPNVSNVSTIVVSNGTLTNDGGGQVTITTGGGGGSSYDDTYISGVATFASGLATQNQADIVTISGLLYDDTAISGYFESRVDSADSDIATVSGLLYDDAAISGYFESRVDSADSDIATVSGLLYDDAAISGYFESRVDQADADIVTVSGLLYDDTAISGYFESRVDAADIEIAAVSGYAEDYTDSNLLQATGISGIDVSLAGTTAYFSAGSLSGYFESRVDSADVGVATVSGLLYNDAALSGYFESRADQADINIDTVSGLLTPSGESFNFSSNVLTYNNSYGGSFSADLSSLAGGGGSTYTAGSGLTLVGTEFNVYGGSGNFEYLEIQTGNTLIPTIKFTGSGVTDTPISLEVASSFESATGSGSALLFQGKQGQLFSITDNLSSGTIFSVSDITGLPMLEIDASGHVQIGEFADDITIHKPILLSGGIPTSTTNKLYNNAGTLYFNGSALGGGLPYSSGDYYLQEIRSNSASGVSISGALQPQITQNASDIATVSGLLYDDAAISGYFESRVDSADSDILTVSGLLYDDTAISGYFESRVGVADADLSYISGIAVYASGLDNYLLNPVGIDGISITSTPESVIFSGDATLARVTDINAVSGVATSQTLQSITDNGSTTSNAITINNDLTAEFIFAELDGPIVFECKNSTGAQIDAGTPVYISGYFGTNGKALIAPARSDDSTKMPAIGVLEEDLIHDAEGHVNSFGRIQNIDTSSFTVGNTVYVAPSGGLTNVRPTGIGELVQNMGKVLRSDASQGRILLLGPGRSNDVPNSGQFAELTVNGHFSAVTKSFLIDHPSKEGAKLQYASLEGPENGVYVRGTTKETFITLPNYWRDLVHNSSITVTLTSVGSFQPLFVESKSNREIIVGGVCGYYDYVVYGERKDVAKLEVEW
jgi:hypothetical protein